MRGRSRRRDRVRGSVGGIFIRISDTSEMCRTDAMVMYNRRGLLDGNGWMTVVCDCCSCRSLEEIGRMIKVGYILGIDL